MWSINNENKKKIPTIRAVYKITSPTGKIYIGRTVNLRNRFRQHCNFLTRKEYKNNKPLYLSFQKYGSENHVLEVLEQGDIDLDLIEKKYIREYKSNRCRYDKGMGLNLSDGGHTPVGYKFPKNKIHHATKLVVDISTGVFFMSLREASDAYGINYGYLKNMLRGASRNKTNLIYVDSDYKVFHNPTKRQPKYGVINIYTKETFVSITEAAEKLGYSQSYLSGILNGRCINDTPFRRIDSVDVALKSSKRKEVLDLETGIYFDSVEDSCKSLNIRKHRAWANLNNKKRSLNFRIKIV